MSMFLVKRYESMSVCSAFKFVLVRYVIASVSEVKMLLTVFNKDMFAHPRIT